MTDGPRGEGSPAGNPLLDRVEQLWDERRLGDPRAFLTAVSVMRLYQSIAAAMGDLLKPYGVTRTAYLLLATLRMTDRGALPISAAGRQMMLHPTTITLLVEQLEGRDLVCRRAHPIDRRTTLIELTPAGAAFATKATRMLTDAGFGVPGLTPERADSLLGALAPLLVTTSARN